MIYGDVGVGIPIEVLQILKDDAVKVLHSRCQQIWKPLFLRFPSWDRAPSLPPLSPFSSFIFFPTCF